MKNIELLDPMVDMVFKAIFGNPKNIDILSAFIKSILKDQADEFDELQLSDTNLKVESKEDKIGILDIKAITKTGQIINIEVQVLPVPELEERIVFYTSKMITEQIKKGEPYSRIKKVINITILDFELIRENTAYHNTFRLFDNNTQTEFTDVLEIHTLELPKLPVSKDNVNLIKWLKFLKSKTEEEFIMLAEKSPELQRAYDELAYLSQDEETRKRYDSVIKARRDEISRLEGAKKEGKIEGKIEGKEEKAMEVAKNALLKGLPVEIVADITNLNLDVIKKLQQ